MPKGEKKDVGQKKGHFCRLALTAQEDGLDSIIGPLGRSPYILIFETASDQVSVLSNPGFGHGNKAGQITAEEMIRKGVDVVITGTIGKLSLKALKDAGIRVHGGCTQSVKEALDKCLKNELPECMHPEFVGELGI